MLSSRQTPPSPVVREAVVTWSREEEREETCPDLRAPVLPDLRSGGGFSLVVWLSLADISEETSLPLLLVDGTSRVSGSLGEIWPKQTIILGFSPR